MQKLENLYDDEPDVTVPPIPDDEAEETNPPEEKDRPDKPC